MIRLPATTILAVLLSWCQIDPAPAQPPAADAETVQQQLNRQPNSSEKPFAPADGSTATLNPPAFVWLPLAKRPASYVLAVSRDDGFADDATTIVPDVPISVHVPTEPMDAGRWFWRVGVRLSDQQIAWGNTRKFTIPPDARVWPLPKIGDVVAKIPQKHPRLFFPHGGLQKARAECSKSMAAEYASLLRAAQSCIGEDLVPEPKRVKNEDKGSGSPHDYVHIFRSTRPPMDKMERCGLAYLLSGDERFGQEAKRRLLHFFSWDPEGSTSLFHNDEPAMWVMQRGTRAYDFTYDLFTPQERAKIEPVMKARYQQFLKRLNRMPFESRPYSSHPARDLGFLGEGAILFIHEWPEARQWLDYVIKIYWSVYPAWAGDDGGWQEGPGYWGAYMSFALHFVTALEKVADARLVDKPFFRNTPYYKLYTNPPYAKKSPFGDGQESQSSRGAGNLIYQFSSLLQDPYLRWYPEAQNTQSGTGPLGFALADPALKSKPPSELPQARVFPGAGLVAMHDNLADPKNSAYLVMRSSPFGSVSHGHADQNAFAIEAFGEPLAIASGYYPWYGSAHHAKWGRATKAVNCVTIDGGIGQTIRKPLANGRIVRFFTSRKCDYALADATPAYSGRLDKFLRHVIHIRPGTFIIIDELSAPKPVTWEWWLHSLQKMSFDADTGQVSIRRGDARLEASFILPESLDFTRTDKFDPPPENGKPNQWHLTASTRSKSDAALFMVVLQAHKADDQPPALEQISKGRKIGVRWSSDGAEHRIEFGPDGVLVDGIDIVAKSTAL